MKDGSNTMTLDNHPDKEFGTRNTFVIPDETR